MAIGLMLVLPRIPQLLYGTEILMEDSSNPGDHGLIRSDFPGGWDNDKINAFSKQNLTDDQIEMQEYLKVLLNFRKNQRQFTLEIPFILHQKMVFIYYNEDIMMK